MAKKNEDTKKQKHKSRGNGEGSIYKISEGKWCAAITIGRNENGSLKRKYFYGKTRFEVSDKLTADLNSINTGTFVEPNKITVAEWMDIWLYDYKKSNVRPTTFQSYEYLARVHIKPSLGSLLLKNLRPDHIQKMYNEKLKSGRADKESGGLNPKTIKNMHNVLHDALDQAVKNNILLRNSSEVVNTPRHVKKEIKVLSFEDQQKLMQALEGEKYRLAFILALGTGMREGEVLSLRWSDFDLRKGFVKVRRTVKRVKLFDDNKNSHTEVIYSEPNTKCGNRDIPIPGNILRELKSEYLKYLQLKLQEGETYNNIDGYLFVNDFDKPIEAVTLIKGYNKVLKRIGLVGINSHTLRHTYATRLLEANEHPKVVQELLGHSDITMTLNIYSHVMPDVKYAAAAKLDNLFKVKKKSSQSEGS